MSYQETDKQVLLIGAGGVGCEVLKNLVLCGVQNITVIDLDTIEVSNLNRQFLFRKEHVGKSKASVAADAMRKIRPNVKIRPIHGNILDSSILSLNFIRNFSCVINALDNIAARSHVNRLCMAADIALIETGTAGYLGQASFIVKGLTECYDCTPRKDDRNRTYPACTIRNTPSEPAHCVIWAKYLFSQLFGDADPEAEVSPDPDDPELGSKSTTDSNPRKLNTRQWVEQIAYEPIALLRKLFNEDVSYLLRLDTLWKKRVPPVPLEFNESEVESANHAVNIQSVQERDHQVWSKEKCVATFTKSVKLLHERMDQEGALVFDKDDDLAIDFVSSAANLRCIVFGIQNLKRFSVKSIAGNIIAAIATTNSVIAGSAVTMALLNVFSTDKPCSAQSGLFNSIQQILLRRNPVPTGRAKTRTNSIFVAGSIQPPNMSCYVCSPSSKNSVLLEISFDFSDKAGVLKAIRDCLLIGKLRFSVPELVTTDGRVLISGDEEDNDESAMNKTLSEMGISHSGGCMAILEDMIQSTSVSLSFTHDPTVPFDEALDNFHFVPKPTESVSQAATNSRKRPLEKELDVSNGSPVPAKRPAAANGNGNPIATNGKTNGSSVPLDLSPNKNGNHMNGNSVHTNVHHIPEDSDEECVMII